MYGCHLNLPADRDFILYFETSLGESKHKCVNVVMFDTAGIMRRVKI